MLAKLSQLPVDLPVPIDDGVASHLQVLSACSATKNC